MALIVIGVIVAFALNPVLGFVLIAAGLVLLLVGR